MHILSLSIKGVVFSANDSFIEKKKKPMLKARAPVKILNINRNTLHNLHTYYSLFLFLLITLRKIAKRKALVRG